MGIQLSCLTVNTTGSRDDRALENGTGNISPHIQKQRMMFGRPWFVCTCGSMFADPANLISHLNKVTATWNQPIDEMTQQHQEPQGPNPVPRAPNDEQPAPRATTEDPPTSQPMEPIPLAANDVPTAFPTMEPIPMAANDVPTAFPTMEPIPLAANDVPTAFPTMEPIPLADNDVPTASPTMEPIPRAGNMTPPYSRRMTRAVPRAELSQITGMSALDIQRKREFSLDEIRRRCVSELFQHLPGNKEQEFTCQVCSAVLKTQAHLQRHFYRFHIQN